jgi:hypothetical protein
MQNGWIRRTKQAIRVEEITSYSNTKYPEFYSAEVSSLERRKRILEAAGLYEDLGTRPTDQERSV